MISLLPQSRRLSRILLALFLAAALIPGAAAGEAVYHILAKGETLYSLARAYGVTTEAIMKANSIDNPAKLRVGMKLLIPGASGPEQSASPAVKHKVVKGDTLFSIAKTYKVSLESLRAANKLGPSSVIKQGDILIIPATVASQPKGGVATPAPTTEPAPAATPPPAASAVPDKGTAPPVAPVIPEAVKTSTKMVSATLSWPCPGEIRYLEGKAYGVIIKTKQGETEKAVASGTVSSAGPYRGYGNVVFVLSRTGHIYVYGGNESLDVKAGDRVVAGQKLGTVGMDAKQGGPTAYFLVFKNGEAVDPAQAPRD
jgi:murein DD-endopeptidase MepM/ murein hydrolase activator NlpD